MSQRYFHEDIEPACESIKKFRPLLSAESGGQQFGIGPQAEYKADADHLDVRDDVNNTPENHDLGTDAVNQ